MSEKYVLLVSTYAAVAFAVLGVALGIISSSGMVIFDGVYSLASAGLTLLSLYVLQQIQKANENSRFPFGKANLEPLVVIFKSIAIISICLISAFESASVMLEGGSDSVVGYALVYALISTVGCLLVTIYIQKQNQKHDSSLLEAERNQWFGDTILSAGVLFGFTGAFLLEGTELDYLVPYIDPLMVVLASSFFVILPVKSLLQALSEIIMYMSDPELVKPIEDEAAVIAAELGSEHKLRIVVVGRQLSIELNFLTQERSFTVSEMDQIRKRIAHAAESIKEYHWVNVNFTLDPEYL